MTPLRPAAVAVHDHGHVLGQAFDVEFREKVVFLAIGRLQKLADFHRECSACDFVESARKARKRAKRKIGAPDTPVGQSSIAIHVTQPRERHRRRRLRACPPGNSPAGTTGPYDTAFYNLSRHFLVPLPEAFTVAKAIDPQTVALPAKPEEQ